MKVFSIESMERAFSLFCPIVFLVKVFILFSVEKFLSDSADVMGVVMMMLSRVQVSDKASCRFLS